MLYIKDDFYSNFTAIAKSNDTMAMRGIMIDQISNLIADRRGDVIDTLRKSSIKLSNNPSNKELVKAISDNIKSNKKMLVGLSYLVAKQNDILQAENKKDREYEMSFEGKTKKDKTTTTPKTPAKVDWTKFADTTKTIADSFTVTADALTGAKAGAFQDELLSKTNAKSPEQIQEEQKAQEQQNQAKSKRRRNIFIVVGLLVVAGGVFWAYKKGYIGKKSV
jgi:uncharacterized membrane protein